GVWVALYQAGAVQRYLPSGKPDARIDVPAHAVTSLCFGGVDLRDLYVVSADNAVDAKLGGSVFRTRSDVAGLPAPFARIGARAWPARSRGSASPTSGATSRVRGARRCSATSVRR